MKEAEKYEKGEVQSEHQKGEESGGGDLIRA